MRRIFEADLGEYLRAHESDRMLDTMRRHVAVASGLEAAMSDLSAAEERLRIGTVVGQIPRTAPGAGLTSDDIAATMGSLFAHAVLLYARATCDTSKARKEFSDLTDCFNPEERDCHKRLIKLRDKGIAHHDKTGSFVDGPWRQQTVIANLYADQMWPSFRYVEIHYNGNLVADLRMASASASSRGRQLIDETYIALQEELGNAQDRNHAFRAKLVAFPLDTSVYPLSGSSGGGSFTRPTKKRDAENNSQD